MKCKICERETGENRFCELHRKAYESVREKYNAWKKALDISWGEYLSKIVDNRLTGEWAKEVSEYLIKMGER